MTYDVELADRLRARLSGEPGVTEKRMFGGLAFLVGGHMAVAASGQGGLLLRIDPDAGHVLAGDPRVGPFVMRGKPMAGWLRVEVDGDVGDEDLARWLDSGVAAAKALPPR